jgi:hypothetical protein
MNFRAEIDALPPRPDVGYGDYWLEMYERSEAKLALAARIHAEPHSGGCAIGCWDKALDDRTMVCTCGKDAAMAEVLG